VIQELRIYEVKVGQVAAYLDAFETLGLPIARKYLNLAGFWTSEFGAQNEVYHLWEFRSLEHRVEARARLHADPDWRATFMPRALELVTRQHNLILKPTRFSPAFNSGLDQSQR
jgi:hypothetical protein